MPRIFDDETVVIIGGGGSAVVEWGPTYGPGNAGAAGVSGIITQALGEPGYGVAAVISERQAVALTALSAALTQAIDQAIQLEVDVLPASLGVVQALGGPDYSTLLNVAEQIGVALAAITIDMASALTVQSALTFAETVGFDIGTIQAVVASAVTVAYSLEVDQAITAELDAGFTIGEAQGVGLTSLAVAAGLGTAQAVTISQVDIYPDSLGTIQALTAELDVTYQVGHASAVILDALAVATSLGTVQALSTLVSPTLQLATAEALALVQADIGFALTETQAVALTAATITGIGVATQVALAFSATAMLASLGTASALTVPSLTATIALAETQAVTTALALPLAFAQPSALALVSAAATATAALGEVQALKLVSVTGLVSNPSSLTAAKTGASSVTSGSFTPTANALLIVSGIVNQGAGPATVTGGGLTWTIKHALGAYIATATAPSSPSAMTITVTAGAGIAITAEYDQIVRWAALGTSGTASATGGPTSVTVTDAADPAPASLCVGVFGAVAAIGTPTLTQPSGWTANTTLVAGTLNNVVSQTSYLDGGTAKSNLFSYAGNVNPSIGAVVIEVTG